MLVQLRWKDERLAYSNFSQMTELIGQRPIVDRVWRPHIFGSNEHESSLMGLTFTDQVISITPHGDVLYSARVGVYKQPLCDMFPSSVVDYATCLTYCMSWPLVKAHLHIKKSYFQNVETRLHILESMPAQL
ncbi:Transducin (beta)-like 3 [Homalodisca vitripennis]|nr:Transducin (beta)-like 3 [Homalodisca vitripennis]